MGRLGGALAIALARGGYAVENVISRNSENAERIAKLIEPPPLIFSIAQFANVSSDVVLICTPDPQIELTARLIAENLNFKSGTIFLHTSGSMSSAILGSLKDKGASIGSLHPLVSVSAAETGAEKFSGAYFCVEGDSAAVAAAEKIVADLGGASFSIETKYKTLYHAAAVMAAGHAIALFDAAVEILSDCGVDEAQKILLPLVTSAIGNLEAQTPSAALTGTFARADLPTMTAHLGALNKKTDGNTLRIYIELGLRSIELARTQGADEKTLTEMERRLKAH